MKDNDAKYREEYEANRFFYKMMLFLTVGISAWIYAFFLTFQYLGSQTIKHGYLGASPSSCGNLFTNPVLCEAWIGFLLIGLLLFVLVEIAGILLIIINSSKWMYSIIKERYDILHNT